MQKSKVDRTVGLVLVALLAMTLITQALHADPPAPTRAALRADIPSRESAKFIFCGCADANHRPWFGSEEGADRFDDGKWTRFTAAEGLAEDHVTALACDPLGRIWAGHLCRGVSVYNGTSWKNYDRAGGLAGAHVYCIAISPVDGDVWIATDAGLSRYSLKNDSWSTYDRSTGMPDEQASAMAFDSNGTIYLALQSGGIGVAHPTDNYHTWAITKGPAEVPIRNTGGGLPSSQVNALLVTRDGAVLAGTTHGLACSVDEGVSWSYVRGRNWPIIAQGRYLGAPDDLDINVTTPISEDWITQLAQDSTGMIWVGYQNAGYQTYMPDGTTADVTSKKNFVTAIVPIADGRCMIGTYGNGAIESGAQYTGPAIAAPSAPASALKGTDFPTPPAIPDSSAIAAMQRQLESLAPGKDGVQFLADDWETGGDWVGTYGSRTAQLLGFHDFHSEPAYHFALCTGPYRKAYMRYYWDDKPNAPEHRLLLDPRKPLRLYCENNDESYNNTAHPRTQQGPDLYIRITLPGGVHRVSLYFQNHDAHNAKTGIGVNGQRDYVLQVKQPAAADDDDDLVQGHSSYLGQTQLEPSDSTDAELAPTLAEARVSNFQAGVYKRLLIHGAGTYWIKINRNYSPCCKVSAVFIDRLDGKQSNWVDAKFKLPPPTDYTSDTTAKGAAYHLWTAADAAVDRDGAVTLVNRARLMAYRAGVAAGIDEDTLATWRQTLSVWTDNDREHFDQAAGFTKPEGL